MHQPYAGVWHISENQAEENASNSHLTSRKRKNLQQLTDYPHDSGYSFDMQPAINWLETFSVGQDDSASSSVAPHRQIASMTWLDEERTDDTIRSSEVILQELLEESLGGLNPTANMTVKDIVADIEAQVQVHSIQTGTKPLVAKGQRVPRKYFTDTVAMAHAVRIQGTYAGNLPIVDIENSRHLYAVLDSACNSSTVAIRFIKRASIRLDELDMGMFWIS